MPSLSSQVAMGEDCDGLCGELVQYYTPRTPEA